MIPAWVAVGFRVSAPVDVHVLAHTFFAVEVHPVFVIGIRSWTGAGIPATVSAEVRALLVVEI